MTQTIFTEILDVQKFSEIVYRINDSNLSNILQHIQTISRDVLELEQRIGSKTRNILIDDEKKELEQIQKDLTKILGDEVLEERYFLYLENEFHKDVAILKDMNSNSLSDENKTTINNIKQKLKEEVQKLSKLTFLVKNNKSIENNVIKKLSGLDPKNNKNLKRDIKTLHSHEKYMNSGEHAVEAMIQLLQKVIEESNFLKIEDEIENLEKIDRTLIRNYKWHVLRGLRKIINDLPKNS